jgi:hypothetical protein
MSDFFKVLGAVVAVIAVAFFITLFGVLGGIVVGWVVGLFFTDLIVGFISRFGVNTVGLEVWQIGGALGFIGAFFKTVNTNTTAD